MGSETRQLCEFVQNTGYSDLPDTAKTEAKRMMMDAIGAALAGLTEENSEIAERSLGIDSIDGSSTVWGRGTSGSPGPVALINGTLAHTIEFDDKHDRLGGHPTVPVLPAVLALGEELNASGKDTIRAFALGVEVQTVLADIMHPGHFEKGWHPTSVLGHLGSAIASGVLLNLSTKQLRQTLGLVSSKTGGIKANFGTMTKSFHAGNAARNGIEAARFVDNGFTASEQVLEDKFGFCELFQGNSGYEFGDRFEHLGDPWGMINPPAAFKAYPCCAGSHAGIDAAIEITDETELEPDEIEEIVYTTHPRRLPTTDNPDPTTQLEALFSVQYAIAVGLLKGDVWFDDFSQEAIHDPERRALMNKVTVEGSESNQQFEADAINQVSHDLDEYDLRFTDIAPTETWAHLSVLSATGEEYTTYVSPPRGFPPRRLEDDELREKFRRCTRPVLDDTEVEEILQLIERLETIDDVNSLTEQLTSPSFDSEGGAITS